MGSEQEIPFGCWKRRPRQGEMRPIDSKLQSRILFAGRLCKLGLIAAVFPVCWQMKMAKRGPNRGALLAFVLCSGVNAFTLLNQRLFFLQVSVKMQLPREGMNFCMTLVQKAAPKESNVGTLQ